MPFDAPPEFAPGQPKSTRRSVNASTGDRENLPPPDSPGSLDPPSAGREGSHPHTAGSASPQRDVVLSIHIVGEDEPPCRFPASIHAAGGRMLVRIDGRAELGRAHRHYLLNVPVPDPAATGCYSWPMPIDERAFNDILRATAGPTVAPPPSPARLPLTDIPLNGAMQPPPTGHRAGFYPPVTFVPLVRPPPKVSPTLPSVPLSGAVRRPPQQALPVPRTVLNIIRDPTTRPPHFSLFPNHAHPHVVAPGPRRLPPFPLPCPPADPAPVPVTLNGTVHDLYPSSAVRVTLEGIRGLRPRRRPTPAELQASQEFLAHLRHLASQQRVSPAVYNIPHELLGDVLRRTIALDSGMQLIDCRLQIMACFMQPREVSLLVAMRIGLDRQIALCIESPPRTAISLQSMRTWENCMRTAVGFWDRLVSPLYPELTQALVEPAWPASRPPSPPPPGNEARQPAQPASRTSRGSSSPSARMKPAQR